jgi:hypothetical protein
VRRCAAALAALSLVAAVPSSARELWSSEGGGVSLDFRGSLRELVTASEQTSREAFEAAAAADSGNCVLAATFENCSAFNTVGKLAAVQSLTRLRTRFDARLPHGLSATLVYDHELDLGHLETFERGFASGISGSTLLGAEGVIAAGRHVEWRHRLYRGSLSYERGPFELEVGRQRLAWGVGRLWNPIDRLNAIGPLAIEADQSGGIDALVVRWNFDGFRMLELVYAPARDKDDSRYAARLRATVLDTDVSLIGGLFRQAPTAGFDLSRNLGDAAIRLEVVWTRPEDELRPVGSGRSAAPDPYWQVVASIDHNFDLGTGLYLLLEHLYNGNALGFGRGLAGSWLPFFEETAAGGVVPASDAVFGGSQVVSGAEHQTGLQLGYDLTPELRGEFLAIFDWSGESGLLFPALRYSPDGAIEISAGAQIGVGSRRSEYGPRGALGYLMMEFFF